MSKAIYTGVNGVARKVKQPYIAVDGVARKAKAGYVGVNGVARQFWAGGTPLGAIPVGKLVKLNENGVPVEFYVAKHDYESGLNGAGRTLMVRKDLSDLGKWANYGESAYATSIIDAFFNGTYKNVLDPNVRALIGTTKFYYVTDDTAAAQQSAILTRSVFALSPSEYCGKTSDVDYKVGTKLPTAAVLKIAKFNGEAAAHWTRCPGFEPGSDPERSVAQFIDRNGRASYTSSDAQIYYRPAFTLPATTIFNEDMTISF